MEIIVFYTELKLTQKSLFAKQEKTDIFEYAV